MDPYTVHFEKRESIFENWKMRTINKNDNQFFNYCFTFLVWYEK